MLFTPFTNIFKIIKELFPAALFTVRLQVRILIIEVILALGNGICRILVNTYDLIDEVLDIVCDILKGVDLILLSIS